MPQGNLVIVYEFVAFNFKFWLDYMYNMNQSQYFISRDPPPHPRLIKRSFGVWRLYI